MAEETDKGIKARACRRASLRRRGAVSARVSRRRSPPTYFRARPLRRQWPPLSRRDPITRSSCRRPARRSRSRAGAARCRSPPPGSSGASRAAGGRGRRTAPRCRGRACSRCGVWCCCDGEMRGGKQWREGKGKVRMVVVATTSLLPVQPAHVQHANKHLTTQHNTTVAPSTVSARARAHAPVAALLVLL